MEHHNEFLDIDTIRGYQALYTPSGQLLAEAVQTFIDDLRASLLVIKGQAGCGKSVFLQDQARRRATDALREMRNLGGENVTIVQTPIPVFWSLNSFVIGRGESLARKLLKMLTGEGLFDIPPDEPEKIFEDNSKHWLIFLDAFDEVNPNSRDDVWSAIIDLSQIYRSVKVILTVRPGEFRYRLPHRGQAVEVAPLRNQQVWNFLEAQELGPAQLNQIAEFLSTEPELWEHLRVPLFLSTSMQYFSGGELSELPLTDKPEVTPGNKPTPNQLLPSASKDEGNISLQDVKATVNMATEQQVLGTYVFSQNPGAEPVEPLPDTSIPEFNFRKGYFLDRVYRRLWEHNEKKQFAGLERGSSEELYINLAKMAAAMAGQDRIQLDPAKMYVGDGLWWILDLGILLRKEVWVFFLTTLSRAYFAAYHISLLLDRNDQDGLLNIVRDSPAFWERCREIAEDLAYDVSPLNECIHLLKGA